MYRIKGGGGKQHDSWSNLKGDGQLVNKAGNGEQMIGMVPGLGSVSRCRSDILRSPGE
jgi:hypothetical protein